MNKKIILIILVAVALAYGAGRLQGSKETSAAADGPAATEYTCSMHPQIRQPAPGLCPICAMDLIPVTGDQVPTGPRSLSLTSAARTLARIETSPVVRGQAVREIRVAGTLQYQSARAREITLFAEAQIRNVLVPANGMRVKAGDALADVYSPDVFSAARELNSAGSNELLIKAARQKLKLLGVADQDIEAIASSTGLPDTIPVRSPIDGITTGIKHHPGEWIMKGAEITRVLDDSVLWAELDLYAQDIPFISPALPVTLIIRALPGQQIDGTIVSISSDVDDMTRAAKMIVEIPNRDRKLKPGMIAEATIRATLPGEQLLVPATAVLMTGQRALVYVQDPVDDSIFESRIATLGPRAGDVYVVNGGLREGERVVSRGTLKVDSTMQLLAKPSMMTMPSESGADAKRRQTLCPVEGGEIERDVFVDYGGYRIYFCCPGCDTEFLAAPDQFLDRMKAEGIELEPSPVTGSGTHQH